MGMIQIDPGIIAVIITVLFALIGLAVAWGALGQRVKIHDKVIEDNRKRAERDIEKVHNENREDHRQIFQELREIKDYIRNKGSAK